MSSVTPQSKRDLPRWMVVTGSVAIIFHLVAVTVPFLDTPSGPWPVQVGRSVAEPPPFAHSLSSFTTAHARYLRIAHSHHYATNRPADMPAAEFEVRLKDEAGNLLHTLKFPNPQASPWVRHRQELLASALALDVRVEPPGGEVLPAPNAKAPTLAVWLLPDDLAAAGVPPPPDLASAHKGQAWLCSVPLHLVPRNRPVLRPLELSQVMARSYARHLCREHGAARAEIIRFSREPVPPAILFGSELPAQVFEPSVGSFGEMSR